MTADLKRENDLLRSEIRVLHEAAELTADLVIQQFEQTEHEKHRYQEAAANLEGFKRTLDQTSDCVFMFDPQTFLFTYVNHGGLNLTGYSEKELYAMTLADLGTDCTTDKLTKTLEPLIEDPTESLMMQTTYRRKNGIEVPVEIFIQYISPTGVSGRFFSIVRNISKRLLEEKEKEQMQTKLLHTQKLESVGELAAGIAHEINTPIQYVSSNLSFVDEAFSDFLELLQKYHLLLTMFQQKEDPRQQVADINDFMKEIDIQYLVEEIPEAIQQAKDGVDRVSKLVMAMKDFSHPGSKEKEQANINKIIQTTLQISRNEWKYCADVDLMLAEDLPMVHCHPTDIGQVVLNLLLNAAHSIKERLGKHPDSHKGLITLQTLYSDDAISLRITDNGCGIPQNIIDKIFDPFFTTKEVGKGTGQGLAITRNVITSKHGGEIDVASEVGRGTTFTIHLPRGKN